MNLFKFVKDNKFTKEVTFVEEIERNNIDEGEISKDYALELLKKYNLKDENQISLEEKYKEFHGNKILIKCFSYEGNLRYYNLLEQKQEAIDSAIKLFKIILGDVEIKFVKGIPYENGAYDIREEALIKKVFTKEDSMDNVIIEDLLTLVYIGEAFLLGKELDYAYVSLTGNLLKENLLVKINKGTTLNEIAEKLELDLSKINKVILGGAFNGEAQFNLEGIIESYSKGIIFISQEKEEEVSPCIRCSKCLRVCPVKLNPIKLVELSECGEKEEFFKYGGQKCIECGLCSYVCPSKIEISSKIKTTKVFINKR